ncbi:MAG: helix-turn-helix transcriptional regulator [Clostridia bacterium]|nr:helix-turn-helix transcriptional regulator [Clostridia bacterium]
MRVERSITQEQLAKKLNISLKTISHWETGYTEPSITQLIAIADLYSISLDELVGRNF